MAKEKKEKKQGLKKQPGAHDRLKWETARELGLEDDLAKAGDELTVREAGKIGGNMVKKLIKAGENALGTEDRQNPVTEPDKLRQKD